ncbi:calcium-binding protein [Hoeflea sp.]|uniref:calcium-binding protein n=1 Tax=Hoeflea sp. TaxID=1940281 RepID=UPI003BAFE053
MSNSLPYLSGLTLNLTIDEEAANLGPQLIDSDVTFVDADNNFDGGTLVLSGLLADDIASIRHQGTGAGEIGFSGGNITFGGTLIGTASGGEGTALSVTFNASATSASIEALIENLTFATLSDMPGFTRTLELTVRDAAGAGAIAPFTMREQLWSANPGDGMDVGNLSQPVLADLDGDGDIDLIIGEEEGNINYFENTGTGLAAVFTERTGTANPFDGIDLGNYSPAAVADLDGDGDLDLVVGENGGGLFFVENTGTRIAAAYTVRTAGANPFNGIDVGDLSMPALGDLDGDGDLDLVVGEENGNLNYFENTGTALAPVYVARTGDLNPFGGIDVGSYGAPALADIDGDGDLDLLVGEQAGDFDYFENTGNGLAATYEARTGAANPFGGFDVGFYATPALGDMDGDGDLDLVSGANIGDLSYFETHTAPSAPAHGVFLAHDGSQNPNPLASIDVGSNSTPILADLDGDGDLDLIVGEEDGVLNYYRHTASSYIVPLFTERTGAANPFDGIDIGFYSKPALADIDGDGDLDLVVGEFDGNLNYYENTGSGAAPAFTARSGPANPFDGLDVGLDAAPVFADLDGDGDADLILGRADGTVGFFENTGTSLQPAYTARTGTANPFDGIDIGSSSRPAFHDLDADGDLDLVVGTQLGTLEYFENTGTGLAPVYTARTGSANPFNGIDIGAASTPVFGDLDHDGDLELVIGQEGGGLDYYENVAVPVTSVFTQRTGAANPFDGIDIGYFSTPSYADLDGDGDLDLVIGEPGGILNYYENTGTALAPAYMERTGAANPFDGIDVGIYSTPGFSDLDGDGDLDLVVGNGGSILNYFENTGTAVVPTYTARTGAANPFDGIDTGSYSAPTFADLDGDGDLDLVVGEQDGSLNHYENTGTALAPAYTERTGTANPFDGIDIGSYSSPSFADLDGDGDLDLVIGREDGNLNYYGNTGTALAPSYTARTGPANPFDGIDVGSFSTPSFADLDGDGDLDLVIGREDGNLNYYENTGPAGFQFVLNVTQHADPSAQADVINGTSENNYLYGLGGDDTLRGLGGNDMLFGGLGADAMDGGADFDYARYDNAASAVAVYLANDRPNSGEAAGDTFANIEGLILSAHNDYGFGDDGANYIYGQGGSDSLAGGLGADYLDGGEGFDYVRYDDAAYPDDIRVYLQSQYSNLNTGVAAIGDIFVSIEGLQTSVRNDTLFGNSENNILLGNLGTDNLYGFTGNDTLYGGAGDPNGDGVRDNFVFDQAPIAANADIVGDFERGLDQIALSSDIFGTNEARIQFNAGTRELVYTGVNGNEYNVIATLVGETVFDAGDFYFY